jgi:hypothetical protein
MLLRSTSMYYLYIKTHNVTGLKYLGYTSRSDYHTYLGSGLYWRRHLAYHGHDYSTSILLATDSKQSIKVTGGFYSNLYNIVESKEWANLKPEDGMGGTHIVTEEQKLKQSKKMKGRYGGEKNPMYGKRRKDTTLRNQLPKKWVTDGVTDKFVLLETLNEYLDNGYVIGRSCSNNKGSKMKPGYKTIECEICKKHIRPTNHPRHYKKCLSES